MGIDLTEKAIKNHEIEISASGLLFNFTTALQCQMSLD